MNEHELKRLFPNASASTLARNADRVGLRSPKPEHHEGLPLVPREKGARPRPPLSPKRLVLRLRVFSSRPCDWDNYRLKYLQDGLRHAGLLDGDEWNLLRGEVTSEKAYSGTEERTEITIE